jgi:hypothetical protein
MEIIWEIWEFFNSKKTAIGAFAFATSDLAVALGYPDIAMPLKNIAYVFTGTGLSHKVVKTVKL